MMMTDNNDDLTALNILVDSFKQSNICGGWQESQIMTVAAKCIEEGFYKLSELCSLDDHILKSFGFRFGDITRMRQFQGLIFWYFVILCFRWF